jgi:PEP-CTERM motif
MTRLWLWQRLARDLRALAPLAAGAAWLLTAAPAGAISFTLVDDNSTVNVDTGAQDGAYDWLVDGADQLYQEWFWYRVGNDPEASIDTLTIDTQGTSDTNFDGDDDTLFVRYLGTGFEIELSLTLDGGTAGSGASDLAEQITITNTSGSALDFHFFEYTDLDLGGTILGDSVIFPNANTVDQTEGTLALSETVATPTPSHHQATSYPTILNLLNDGVASNLDDTPAIGTQIGPGDMTWAFQWDFSLAAAGAANISKDKRLSIVPEPGTGLLLALGLGGLVGGRRKRS